MAYKKTYQLITYINFINKFNPKTIKNRNLREELLSKEVDWDEMCLHCWKVDSIISQVKSDDVVPFHRLKKVYELIHEYTRLDELIAKPRKQKIGFGSEEE